MIDSRQIERDILAGWQKWLTQQGIIGCEFARSNEIAPIPPYPYVSYQAITTKANVLGTYAEVDGGFEKEARQTWSITVHSEDDDLCNLIVIHLHDWLSVAGHVFYKDRGIVVQSTTNITSRDNLLQNQFEYIKGFDAVLTLTDRINTNRAQQAGWVETAPPDYTTI